MAWTDNLKVITLEAGADLSSSQYFFVAVNASGQVVAAGDGAHADGVVQNDPDSSGKAAQVAIGGVVKVKCGGTVTNGGDVASDTNGKCVDAASGDAILGTALQTGASDEVISILFHPRG